MKYQKRYLYVQITRNEDFDTREKRKISESIPI
jgi:hypothetical protein